LRTGVLSKDEMVVEYFDLHYNPEFTFSSCVRAGDFVYTAHHGAWTYEDAPEELGIEEQTTRTLENLRVTLDAAGASLDDTVQTTVWLRRKEDFRGMRDTFRRYFKKGFPVRMTAFTDFLNDKCLIMIEIIAYAPKSST